MASTLSTKYVANMTSQFEREVLSALNVTECKFRDFSDRMLSYEYSEYDYQVLLARLLFLLFYEVRTLQVRNDDSQVPGRFVVL